MSRYVAEIIKDINLKPETWENYRGDGIVKGRIIISPMTPLLFLVTAEITIDGREQYLTYLDKLRLEIALRKWFRNASLSKILGE